MTELEWSLLLDGFGLIPITLLAYKKRVAYLFYIVMMAMWIVYALDKGGYGFIPGAIIYSGFYVFGWHKWRPSEPGMQPTLLEEEDLS